MKDFIENIQKLQDYLQNDVYDDIGIQAVKHYEKSFDDQAFSDKAEKDMKWQDVKRRDKKSKWYGFNYNVEGNFDNNATTRLILVGDNKLGRSISYERRGGFVAITSPLAYAEVHNTGGKAKVFGKATFTMPKRQFIGHSDILDAIIAKKIEKRMRIILKIR